MAEKWNFDNLPTWKECRLIVDNYEYSTTKGVTGMESPPIPLTQLQSFIYENEPLTKECATYFRLVLIDVLNLADYVEGDIII